MRQKVVAPASLRNVPEIFSGFIPVGEPTRAQPVGNVLHGLGSRMVTASWTQLVRVPSDNWQSHTSASNSQVRASGTN